MQKKLFWKTHEVIPAAGFGSLLNAVHRFATGS